MSTTRDEPLALAPLTRVCEGVIADAQRSREAENARRERQAGDYASLACGAITPEIFAERRAEADREAGQ